MYWLGRLRAKKILAKILPLLADSQTVLDIGCGTGNIAELLIKNGKNLVPLDVRNLSFVKEIKPVLYNGEKIPFPESSFDAALLICVLHHAKNPKNLLKEAKRVAKKIIVVEDIHKNTFHKWLTRFFDNLLSLEFFKNPHSNKTDKEWRKLFDNFNLKLEHSEYYRSLLVFQHVLYQLATK